jgi:hypothetical protein
MAITLLVKKTRARIGSITLDAAISEQHQAEVEVTDNPVEEGIAITDHVRPKPEVLTIEGIVTNTPLPADADAQADLQQVETVTPTGESLKISSRSSYKVGRAENAYQDLLTLKDSGKTVQVVTGLRTYDNMLMTSLSVPRDAKTGQAVRFTATFREIKIVRTQVVKVARKEKKTFPKTDNGKKPTTPANQSLLHAGVHSEKGQQVLNFFGKLGN